MTDDFDDDALRDAFGNRSGGPVDPGPARAAVISRATRTRTIRSVAVGGASTVIVVAGLAVLSAGNDADPPANQPAAPTLATVATTQPRPSTSAPRDDVTEPTLDVSSTTGQTGATTTEAPEPTEPDTSTPSSTQPTDAPTTPPVEPDPPPTAAVTSTDPPATTPAASTPASTAPSSTVPPTAPSTDPPDPADAPFTRQYDSTGGSITVNWDGAALSLIDATPNPGYETEIEDQTATRIRVRFRGDDDSRIEVRAQDGKVEHNIS